MAESAGSPLYCQRTWKVRDAIVLNHTLKPSLPYSDKILQRVVSSIKKRLGERNTICYALCEAGNQFGMVERERVSEKKISKNRQGGKNKKLICWPGVCSCAILSRRVRWWPLALIKLLRQEGVQELPWWLFLPLQFFFPSSLPFFSFFSEFFLSFLFFFPLSPRGTYKREEG